MYKSRNIYGNMTYALDDDNKIINIRDTIRKKKYICMECNNEVILKKGKKLVHHYAHKSKVSNCCNESYKHKLAKELIKKNLQKITFYYCSKFKCNNNFKFENKQYECIFEYKVDKFKVDVAIIKNNKLILAVEVYNTCRNTKEKNEYFKNNKIPMIEIKCDEIIEKNIITDVFFRNINNSLCCLECQNIIDYEELNKNKNCNCNILINNLCICLYPSIELVMNNNFCIKCNKWLCRCLKK